VSPITQLVYTIEGITQYYLSDYPNFTGELVDGTNQIIIENLTNNSKLVIGDFNVTIGSTTINFCASQIDLYFE